MMKTNDFFLCWAFFFLMFAHAVFAAGSTTPTGYVPVGSTGAMVQDLNAGGHDVNNVGAITATTYNGAYIRTGRKIYVDPVSGIGDNSTGTRERNGKPFATISAGIAVAQAGDTILCSGGHYTENLGIVIPNNVNLIGEGPEISFIDSSRILDSGTGGVIVNPGTNSLIRGFTITSNNVATGFGAAMGVQWSNTNGYHDFTNARGEDCHFIGDTDAVYMHPHVVADLTLINCTATTKWDTCVAFSGATITLYNPALVSTGNSTFYDASTPIPRGLASLGGHIICHGGVIKITGATGAGSVNDSIYADGSFIAQSLIEVYGTKLYNDLGAATNHHVNIVNGSNAKVVLGSVSTYDGGALVTSPGSGLIVYTGSASDINGVHLASLSNGVVELTGGVPSTVPTNTFMTPVMTALGDIMYGGASGALTRLAGYTTANQAVLAQTGTGSASAACVWTNAPALSGANMTGLLKTSGDVTNVFSASGAYQITTSAATITGDISGAMTVTLPATGNYVLHGRVQLTINNATYSSPQNVYIKFRRTSGSATNIGSVTKTLIYPITSVTAEGPSIYCGDYRYAGTAGDVIAIQASLDNLPTGSGAYIGVDDANFTATPR